MLPEAAVGRTVTFDYGHHSDDGLSSLLDRITRITYTEPGDPGFTDVTAEYEYGGLSRRIGLAYGNGLEQNVAFPSEYAGLDRFGRLKDLNFRIVSGPERVSGTSTVTTTPATGSGPRSGSTGGLTRTRTFIRTTG